MKIKEKSDISHSVGTMYTSSLFSLRFLVFINIHEKIDEPYILKYIYMSLGDNMAIAFI